MSSNTVYIFPGQGSQFSGMGKTLFETSRPARDMFERANEILGFKITDIMFEGNDEDLKATRVTQPAIFLHSYILAATLEDFHPFAVAGHSLGEFSALAAAGAIKFEDALSLVEKRALAMQKCCDSVPGGMAAVIGIDNATIERICSQVEGVVVPANYNSDGQVVISGEKDALEKACALLKEAGARRALPIAVGGAFHSPLMEPARMELAKAIEATEFKAPFCPVYQNVSAVGEMDAVCIKGNLLKQLTSPVKWSQSVRKMVSDGAGRFVEVGPGSVLQGLVKRIAGPEVVIEGIN